MSHRTPPVEHSTYQLERRSETYRMTIINPSFRLNRTARLKMHACAKAHGLEICFSEALKQKGAVVLSDSSRNRLKTPLEERVHRFARHIAPGGEERDDTILAGLQMAGAAI
jgi:hypothetical protein